MEDVKILRFVTCIVVPAHVAQWSQQSCAMLSKAWRTQWPEFKPRPGRFHIYQRIISNNLYAHDEQGDNPGHEYEGSTVSSINCDRCRHLDLVASMLSAAPVCVEVNSFGLLLAGVTHSASQR